MKHYNIYIIFFILILIAGCKTTQKAVENQAGQQNEIIILTEDKRIEFEFLYIEGLKQKMLGNIDAATQYFNNCVEINPGSAASLYELASIHATKGELISAKLLLERAIEINPDNKWYKLLLAQIYQNSNQYEQASRVYTELIEMEPENIDFLYLNAILLTTSGKYNEAIKAYNDLEKIMGPGEQISLSKQHVYRTAGKNKEAYAEIEKLIGINPDVPEYYGIMADMYKEDGNVAKALEYYNKVLQIDPSNGFVYFSLATFYIQNNETEMGYQYALKGFANPNVEIETKIQFYLMLLSAPQEMKVSDEQIEELINLMVITHPSDSRSYSIQADFLIQRGKHQEARDFMLKALDIDPNSYPLWEQLLITENQIQDFESMAKNSEKALELFPSQPLLYILSAVANLQLKNYEQTIKSLENGQIYVVDNKKMEAQFEMYRAEAYYNLDKSDKAFTAFENVIKNDPENYMAMNNYAYYLSVRGEELEKAEKMSSMVIQANPDNPTYLDTHAWVLFKKNEYRLAKFYIETALKNGGDENDVILEHYGDILFMLNNVEQAVAYWQKALDMGNESETLRQKIIERRYIEGDE